MIIQQVSKLFIPVRGRLKQFLKIQLFKLVSNKVFTSTYSKNTCSLTLSSKYRFSSNLEHLHTQANLLEILKRDGFTQKYAEKLKIFVSMISNQKEKVKFYEMHCGRVKMQFGQESQIYFDCLVLQFHNLGFSVFSQEALNTLKTIQQLIIKYPHCNYYQQSEISRNIQFFIALNLLERKQLELGVNKLHQYLNDTKRNMLDDRERIQYQFFAKQRIMVYHSLLEEPINNSELYEQCQSLLKQAEQLKKPNGQTLIPDFEKVPFYIEKMNFHIRSKEVQKAKESAVNAVKILKLFGQEAYEEYQKSLFITYHLIKFEMKKEAIEILEKYFTYVTQNKKIIGNFQFYNSTLQTLYQQSLNQEGVMRCNQREQLVRKSR